MQPTYTIKSAQRWIEATGVITIRVRVPGLTQQHGGTGTKAIANADNELQTENY
jgi:hypothetical protein